MGIRNGCLQIGRTRSVVESDTFMRSDHGSENLNLFKKRDSAQSRGVTARRAHSIHAVGHVNELTARYKPKAAIQHTSRRSSSYHERRSSVRWIDDDELSGNASPVSDVFECDLGRPSTTAEKIQRRTVAKLSTRIQTPTKPESHEQTDLSIRHTLPEPDVATIVPLPGAADVPRE
jgi:hypothetical protein